MLLGGDICFFQIYMFALYIFLYYQIKGFFAQVNLYTLNICFKWVCPFLVSVFLYSNKDFCILDLHRFLVFCTISIHNHILYTYGDELLYMFCLLFSANLFLCLSFYTSLSLLLSVESNCYHYQISLLKISYPLRLVPSYHL